MKEKKCQKKETLLGCRMTKWFCYEQQRASMFHRHYTNVSSMHLTIGEREKKERKMDIETETATVTVTCLEWCIFWSVCNAQPTVYCALPSAIIPLDVDNKHKSASRTHEEQTTSPHHGICWAFVATHQTDALTDLWSLLPSNSLINEYIYPHSSLFNKRVIASACLTAWLPDCLPGAGESVSHVRT